MSRASKETDIIRTDDHSFADHFDRKLSLKSKIIDNLDDHVLPFLYDICFNGIDLNRKPLVGQTIVFPLTVFSTLIANTDALFIAPLQICGTV